MKYYNLLLAYNNDPDDLSTTNWITFSYILSYGGTTINRRPISVVKNLFFNVLKILD